MLKDIVYIENKRLRKLSVYWENLVYFECSVFLYLGKILKIVKYFEFIEI